MRFVKSLCIVALLFISLLPASVSPRLSLSTQPLTRAVAPERRLGPITAGKFGFQLRHPGKGVTRQTIREGVYIYWAASKWQYCRQLEHQPTAPVHPLRSPRTTKRERLPSPASHWMANFTVLLLDYLIIWLYYRAIGRLQPLMTHLLAVRFQTRLIHWA